MENHRVTTVLKRCGGRKDEGVPAAVVTMTMCAEPQRYDRPEEKRRKEPDKQFFLNINI